MKSQSKAELDTALKQEGVDPSKLWNHQKVCLLIALSYRRFMFHVDMGGGKTLLCLTLLNHRKTLGQTPRAVVLVPYITAIDTWVTEARKHTPGLVCVPLLGSIEQNRATLEGEGDLFIACYQSAVALVTGREETSGKTKWTLPPGSVSAAFKGFDTLVLDEVQKCKNIHSLTYQMCKALARQCSWVYGLTGTPFGRDLQDLWPQFYLIDAGQTLGTTLGFYRAVFFTQKKNYFGGWDFKFQKKLLPDLTRAIKNRSIRYSIEEFADLPPREYIRREFSLPDAARGYAEKALDNLRSALKGSDTDKYRLVESSYLQLRQLSSGFMTFKGEDNDRLQIKFESNPKLDSLSDIVDSLPDGSKLVVFHHFVYTNTLISERLTQMKVPHARVWGGQKDPLGELNRFREDPTCRVLVINSRSGSASLNLQIANYVVFFEQPDSPIDRQQAERRTWRPGQDKRVFYIDLFVRDTYDLKLYEANVAGRDLLRALLDGEET